MNSHVRRAAAGLVIIGTLFGPCVAAFQPDVEIRYRWTKGETLRYRTTQQSTTVMSGLPGGIADMNVEQTISQVYRVVAQDVGADGTTTLQQVLESVKLEIASPMGQITYDSASADGVNPTNQTMASMLSAMIGEPFTLVLSPLGAVQRVEGFSRVVEKMFKSVPQDPAGAAMMNSMKGMFNDDAMRNMMAQGFAQLPGRPLKVGESWNSQITTLFPIFGERTMAIASTLKAIEGTATDQVARIGTQLTITQDPAAPSAPNPLGLKMQMGDSTGEGEILIDVAKGRLLRSSTRLTMPMTMSGPGPDGTPMSMKSTVKGTMTIELMPQ